MIKKALEQLAAGRSLGREEMIETARLIMAGEATAVQIGGLLMGLRMKGETVEELAALVEAMNGFLVPVTPRSRPLLDTCGTGGGRAKVFNVSTASAFVAASAGIAVAKHGNRAASGVCGSADVLEALGAQLDLGPQQLADCIDSVGIAFLFAQRHHPALRKLAGPRQELGVRTIFNMAGALSNPAKASLRVMGVYEERLCPLAAGALKELGIERAIVVHGEPGMVEISTVGETTVCELKAGEIFSYRLNRRALGLPGVGSGLESLAPASGTAENALLLRAVLNPASPETPALAAQRELVAVNAAAALRAAGREEEWPEAVERAFDLLASGAPLLKLEQFLAFGIREGNH